MRRCLENSGVITAAIWNKYNCCAIIVSELNVSLRNYNYFFSFVGKLFWFVALMVIEFENLFLKQLILPSNMPNIQKSSPKSFCSIMTASIAVLYDTLFRYSCLRITDVHSCPSSMLFCFIHNEFWLCPSSPPPSPPRLTPPSLSFSFSPSHLPSFNHQVRLVLLIYLIWGHLLEGDWCMRGSQPEKK